MDPFAVLKDGASFDRKRFAADIALFSGAAPYKLRKKEFAAPSTSSLKKEFEIKTEGENVPSPCGTWDLLFGKHQISESLQCRVRERYLHMAPVQMQAIPVVLERRDLIALAPTGSGKTLSFLLPLLQLVRTGKLRCVVVVPTKELAQQIFREALVLSEGSGLRVCLLNKKSPEIQELQGATEVLVATPLTLLSKLGTARVKSVDFIVLDEVDQLFDLGFSSEIDCILKQLHRKRQCKLMFSATMLPLVEILAKTILINPVKIQVGHKNTAVGTIKHELCFCSTEPGKLLEFRSLHREGQLAPPVLIFLQSKDRARQLYRELTGLQGLALLHADLTHSERETAVRDFRVGKSWILICTDLLARGIDFYGVNTVINYDFPQSVIGYIHRVGRAGRAGQQAVAFTFYTLEDAPYLKLLVNLLLRSGAEVPLWMRTLKEPSRRAKKQVEKRPVKREHIEKKGRLSRGLRRFLKRSRSQSERLSS